MQAIQFLTMTDRFPYPILPREQLIRQMNGLAAKGSPFLFIINYKADGGYVIPGDKLDSDYIRFQFEYETRTRNPERGTQNIERGTLNAERGTQNAEHKTLVWNVDPLSLNDYKPKFEFVQAQMQLGNSFLVNLTQPTKVRTNLSLLDIYNQSTAKYKLWMENSILVLSPETFVRIEGTVITSFPMKGTIDANIPGADEIILNDPKEMAEHATIVDLIRNDLSLVAGEVEVKQYRYLDKIKTNKQDLLQVSSEISGILADTYREHLGNIIFALLPAGSISGAPKTKTLEIIHEAEGYERGFYAGICGFFDGENLDSGVMIRYIEQETDGLTFKSGGGITAQSELIKEYEELIQTVYVPVY